MNLATKLRPKEPQDLLVNDYLKNLIEKIIKFKDFRSFIFYGSPGSGKTSISFILAQHLAPDSFDYFNAAIDNKQKLVELIQNNKIIIIDEIHRLNRDKQDILLFYLENNQVTIYATTTENPFFKVNPALRSRTNIIEVQKPTTDQMAQYLQKLNTEHNLVKIDDYKVYRFLANQSGLDFRIALNNLDLLNKLYSNETLDLETIKSILPNVSLMNDNEGDEYYNYLSAFHKSLRGSDPDAALYYGFLLFKAEQFDAMFRRMLCASYEDVGLAKAEVASQTLHAIEAFERLGTAEGYLPVASAILNIALAPKSNSAYLAAKDVQKAIEEGAVYNVPNSLKDAHYASASKLGRGKGYKYPHEFPYHWVDQQYLPNELRNAKFYKPSFTGREMKLNEYWEEKKKD